ncbi:hypothetical protein Patl1_37654 [Pistacia atlantica]|nr:hypothetical protein Patl1_37654 [Pistacia atlantica]
MVEEGLAIIKKQKVHKAKIEAARELRKKKNNYMSQEMIERYHGGAKLWMQKIYGYGNRV